MSEILDRAFPPQSRAAIKAIAEYLQHAPLTRHADLLRAELLDLIAQEKMTPSIANDALKSRDIEVLRAIQATGFDLNKVSSLRSLNTFSFAQVPTAQRTEMFKAITAEVAAKGANVQHVLNQALSVYDLDLVDAIRDWAPDFNFDALVWGSKKLGPHGPDAPKFWKAILERVDFTSQATLQYATKQVSTGSNPRALATMISKDLLISPLIQASTVSESQLLPWLGRLRARAGTAHGELELKRSLPGLDELLTMPLEQVEVVLGGLSNRQKRKLRNFERKGKVPKSLRELKSAASE